MKAVNGMVDILLKIVMAVSSCVLFVVTFLQVVFRFVLQMPLAWSQDVIRLCFVYLVFTGAAWCVRDKAHLNIDVVLGMFKSKSKVAVELAINVVLLAFFVFLLYYGTVFMQTGTSQTAAYLPLKMSLYYFSVPMCAVLMFYYLVQQVIGQIMTLLGKKGLEGGAEEQ